MDIKIQFIFPNFVIYRVFIDQGLNVLFQLYYNDLGSENIFKIWWTSFFLENIGKILYTEMLFSMVYNFFNKPTWHGSSDLALLSSFSLKLSLSLEPSLS